MNNIPDSSHIAAVIADPAFALTLGVAILSGIVRGFSGFGSALIYIPLVSAIYEPRVAVASFALIDTFCTIPLAVRVRSEFNRQEVYPVTVATILTLPLGAMLLRYVDPIVMRWGIAALIFTLLAVLVSGVRYRGEPKLPLTIGVGLASGISGGAANLTGPFLITYWLGSKSPSSVVRANLIVFFLLTNLAICVTFYFQGLLPPSVIALALVIALPYVLSLLAGAYLFTGASDLLYRRIAFVIVFAAALISLPLFDAWLR